MSDTATSGARPTLAAVAELAGVSASTASLAFSGSGPVSAATRERVLAAAEQLGYGGPDPRAAALRRGRSGVVGVVMEDRLADAFRDPMNVAMLDGVADEAGAAGASLLLLTESGGELSHLTSAPMDAAILVGCSTRIDESVDRLRLRGLPVVAVEAEERAGVFTIGLDNRRASAEGARHLRSLGHERVAVVALPLQPSSGSAPLPADWETRTTSHTALERLRGVRDVYPEFDGAVATGSTVDAGLEAGRLVLSLSPRPTAVIAQSDLLAVGVLRAAEEAGLSIPDDLSVLGFDGIRPELVRPWDLTTLVQPAQEKGRAAGAAVVRLLAGEEPAAASFTCQLHVGRTTGPVTRSLPS
ncbi:LacI family DNA-binding transcriptional regulator [Naasia sp. SYSU D00948]|uniref:LacI family DNA-binding transcriptional regulator n=1 Tax=Naasia sp. SYSU D00948 TaxID=2817379 RepID=UPI001B308BDA|nr:LacI family DNA-binding transcriptional regulator [Naasia sp. SYSU D00948]